MLFSVSLTFYRVSGNLCKQLIRVFMLTIRLQRTGKRNRPEFRVVLAEKTAAANKKFVEVLGSYNPRTKDLVVKDANRLQYWVGQQVELTPTVHNLFVSKAIIQGAKVKAFSVPKKKAEDAAPAEAASPAAEAQTENAGTEAAAEPESQAEPEAAAEAPAQ